MRALSRDLSTSLERTAGVGHNLTKGELREVDLRTAFRPHIPSRFELTSGVIVNSSGGQSKQQDVVVTEAVETPSFIASGGLTVQPIEAVVATIEVKSVATPTTVADSVEKGLSVAALLPDEFRATYRPRIGAQLVRGTMETPFAGTVALTSDASRESLVDAWATAQRDVQLHNRCNALVVIGDFFACWADQNASFAAITGHPDATKVARNDAGEDAMLSFYILLMMALTQYNVPMLDLVKYLDEAGLGHPNVELIEPKWA